MEYTEEQKAPFKQQFAARRRRQATSAILMGAAFLGLKLRVGPVVGALCLVLFLGAMFFYYRNRRCPACDNSIYGVNLLMSPIFCPKCGVALR
jgi:hypothetical protein